MIITLYHLYPIVFWGEKKALVLFFWVIFVGVYFSFQTSWNNFAALYTEWKKNYLVDTVFENNHRRKSKVVNITWYMAWLMIVNNNQKERLKKCKYARSQTSDEFGFK